MDDGAALLRAILENPDEDTPRLAYADWLDEHARDEHDPRTQWAKMIRGQLDPAGPQRLASTLPDVLDLAQRLGASLWVDGFCHIPRQQGEGGPVATGVHVRRGFVDEIHCGTPTLFGGPCDFCAGRGHFQTSGSYAECPRCLGPGGVGTGVTTGLALSVFKHHPVARVVFTDKKPYDDERGWFWSMHSLEDEAEGEEVWDYSLPEELCDVDPKLASTVWNSSEDAVAAASELCVRFGRRAGKLPPLPSLAAWRTKSPTRTACSDTPPGPGR